MPGRSSWAEGGRLGPASASEGRHRETLTVGAWPAGGHHGPTRGAGWRCRRAPWSPSDGEGGPSSPRQPPQRSPGEVPWPGRATAASWAPRPAGRSQSRNRRGQTGGAGPTPRRPSPAAARAAPPPGSGPRPTASSRAPLRSGRPAVPPVAPGKPRPARKGGSAALLGPAAGRGSGRGRDESLEKQCRPRPGRWPPRSAGRRKAAAGVWAGGEEGCRADPPPATGGGMAGKPPPLFHRLRQRSF